MTGVLVTGGTGKVGRELVKLLRGNGVPVRVGSRTPAPGDPGAVRFDWTDPATHPAALAGLDRVFLVPPTPVPAAVGAFLDEARQLGVVLLGSAVPLGPTSAELAGRVLAQPGGIVLRASGFMQNFLSPHRLGERIRRSGEIRTASGAGRVAWVDTRDIAATAAALLGDLDPVPGDYLLTGPEALSYAQAAAAITARTGRRIRVVPVSADELEAELRATGVPAGFAAILAAADAGVRPGREDEIGSAVLDLTGRPPRTFAEFVDDHAARWTGSAG